MTVRFLDLEAQYQSIKHEVNQALAEVLAESAFVGGRFVAAFEESFAAYLGAHSCVGVGNGTDALEIVLEALGLPPESEVLVPANSFIATSEAVTRAGHRVVFCDCVPGTFTLSVPDAERRITPKTRVIVPVHLYGRPCPMDEVRGLAQRHSLQVVEDCAQAHGAEFQGQRVGTFGVAGIFSFYPGKNLGAYGDAGAIVTNDSNLEKRCRLIANHGRTGKYDHAIEGRNSRLDGLQAAVLTAKLPFLDRWIARRIAVAHGYRAALGACAGMLLPEPEGSNLRHVYHLFVIRTPHRDLLQAALRDRGIETGIHYPTALPQLPAYRGHAQARESFLATSLAGQLLSLPMGEHLSDRDVGEVGDAVRQVLCSAGTGGRA